jgi:hypothetical protein
MDKIGSKGIPDPDLNDAQKRKNEIPELTGLDRYVYPD